MSGLISGKILGWRRFWSPWNERVYYGEDGRGFLPDPEERWSKAHNPRVQTIEELLIKRCVVLLGRPGMGKTIAIKAGLELLSREIKPPDCLLELHCRNVPNVEVLKSITIDSQPWKQTRAQGGNVTLVIDGIDEGLRKVPEFVGSFYELIKHEPLERLKIVLVCRSAEWDRIAGEKLTGLWTGTDQSAVVELCSLRQQDAEAAAVAMKIVPEAFIKAIYAKGVQGMAARPIMLKMLLEEFGRGRAISSSNRTLYLQAARHLCSEIDEDREKKLTVHYKRPAEEKIFRVACRIAAMVMLCGKNVVLTSRAAPAAHELSIQEILSGHETHAGERFEVTTELIDAALQTPLFSPRGEKRFGFDHQTFSEILAAEYLLDFKLPQIRRLLCQTLEECDFVTPQLAEVASWLAGGHAGWADFLIENDPEVFLRTDATEITDEQKEKVVAALLARAAKMEFFESFSSKRFYGVLRHPRLTQQLLPVIRDNSAPPSVRSIAINMAGRAKLKAIEPELWKMAGTSLPSGLFSDVAIALRELAGKHSKNQLLRALRGGFPADARRTLMGIALDVVVPGIMPLGKVVQFLTSQPSAHRLGAYEVSLKYHLPKHLKPADVAACLKMLRRIPGCFDTLSEYHDLAVRAFDLALDRLGTTQIASELTSLWIKCLREHEPVPSAETKRPGSKTTSLFEGNRRRKFARVLLNDPAVKVDNFFLIKTSSLINSDVGWLLTDLPKAPVKRRKVWAGMIASLLWSVAREEVADPSSVKLSKLRARLAVACAKCPELRKILPGKNIRFDTVEIMIRKARAVNLRDARRSAKSRPAQPFGPPLSRKMRLKNLLAGTQISKFPSSWVAVSELIRSAQSNDQAQGNLFCHDIRTTPGWQELGPPARRKARKAAREFLLMCADAARPTNQITNFAQAAYHAITLHRHSIAKDRRLHSAIKRKWVKAVVDYPNNGEPEYQNMVAFIEHLAPAAVIRRLLDHLVHEAKSDAYALSLSLRPFARCWNRRLGRAASRYARSTGNTRLVRNVLLFLADHDPAEARRLVVTGLGRRASLRDRWTQACACAALIKFSSSLWGKVWPILASASKPVCAGFFLRNHDVMDERGDLPGCLTEKQSGQFYLRLVQLFPPEKDTRHEGEYVVGALELVQRLRGSALSRIVGAGSGEAIRELQRIIAAQPSKRREHLRWLYQNALRARLQKLWAGHVPMPSEVRVLGRDHSARLIESEDDLLEAIVGSLEKFESVMKAGGVIAIHDLWNIPARKPAWPKPEEFVSKKIAAWLRQDLGESVIVNREVQIESVGGGRTDLKIQALAKNSFNPATLTVIIEVKRCSHRKVRRSCEEQLKKGYLQPNGWSHGLHLVAWFDHESVADADWNDKEEARLAVKKWVDEASTPALRIEGMVVDCRLDATGTPSGSRAV